MNFLLAIVSGLNTVMNGLGSAVLGPLIRSMPGWASNTILSAVVGVLLLILFKYTSNQHAIEKVRSRIKANLLALKLFRDDLSVTAKCQVKIFGGAFMLLWYAIRPMAVMMVPVILLIAQMSLWYEHRPLQIGEKALVSVTLNKDSGPGLSDVALEPNPAFSICVGPTRVASQRSVYWEIEAEQEGYTSIEVCVNGQTINKELAVGNSFMRVSAERPGRDVSAMVMYPLEKPFSSDSMVQSIHVVYPERAKRIWGISRWILYFFVASMVFAFLVKSRLNVHI